MVRAHSLGRIPGYSDQDTNHPNPTVRAPGGGLESHLDTTPTRRPSLQLRPSERPPRHIPTPIRQRGPHRAIPIVPISCLSANHRPHLHRRLFLTFPEECRGQPHMPPLRRPTHPRPRTFRLRSPLVRARYHHRMQQELLILHLLQRQDAHPVPPHDADPSTPTPGSQRPSGSYLGLGLSFTHTRSLLQSAKTS